MMPLTTELGHFYNGEGLWRHPPVCCRFLMGFLLLFILRTCSFRSSCQFLKTRCPSVFDPSSTRWTPGYPAPARWAAADRHESANICDLTSHELVVQYVRLINISSVASLPLPPHAAFMSRHIYCTFELPPGGEGKNAWCQMMMHAAKLERKWTLQLSASDFRTRITSDLLLQYYCWLVL